MSEIHPGAALFSEETRKAVAEGPLFDQGKWPKRNYTRASDDCCVFGALLTTQFPQLRGDTDAVMPDLSQAVEFLMDMGVEVPDDATRDIERLMDRNDMGLYADPVEGTANLYGDLLGWRP